MTIKTLPLDPAHLIETAEDVAHFLEAAFEGGTAEEIAHALETVARSPGIAWGCSDPHNNSSSSAGPGCLENSLELKNGRPT